MSENINNRFKSLREACKKNQEDFGRVIGISKSGISDIESGRRKVTEQHIIMLRNWTEFTINENWLRNGSGDMFRIISEDEEVANYVSELLEDDGTNPVYGLIKEVMKTYIKLDHNSQEVLNDACKKLIENLSKKKEG